MTHLQMKNPLHNEGVSAPVPDDRKGKRTTMTRRVWVVVALLAAGFFLHDALWHTMLAVFGMNTIVGMEFSLPRAIAKHPRSPRLLVENQQQYYGKNNGESEDR